jgi:hypothetical protein
VEQRFQVKGLQRAAAGSVLTSMVLLLRLPCSLRYPGHTKPADVLVHSNTKHTDDDDDDQ